MKKTVRLFLLIFLFDVMFICLLGQTVADIDGNVYKAVQIGNQIWMSENLNVSHFRNGDSIPQAKNSDEWIELSLIGSWCYYKNNIENGRIYGKLYSWYAVSDQRGICPIGWHVPTYDEWLQLEEYLGSEAGGELKKDTILWKNPNLGATNNSVFSALPGGFISGFFGEIGKSAWFWTLTESNITNAYLFRLSFKYDHIISFPYLKTSGLSCRCLKD